jgi:hypothetical protein
LLYGPEVERPARFTKERRRAYSPRPTVRPAERRERIEKLLLEGLTFEAIGAEMGISYDTVTPGTESGSHSFSRNFSIVAPEKGPLA